MPANPTLADLTTLAAEVMRLHARVTPGDLIVNRYDQDDGTIEHQIQATGAGHGAVLGELTDRDSKRAGFDAEAFVYNRTACPTLAAARAALAPALAEWVVAEREHRSTAAAFDRGAPVSNGRMRETEERAKAADAALFDALTGLVAP